MAIKTYKPTTPTRRFQTITDRSLLHAGKPLKSLVTRLRSHGGRDVRGRISIRHRGGGVKRLYRVLDGKQNYLDQPSVVERLEYDPYRSAWIALLVRPDKTKSYILASHELKIGDQIVTSAKAPITAGNRLPLRAIPVGTPIHNLELQPGKGGQIVRSAGSSATIMSKEGAVAVVKLPSSEIRQFSGDCFASIGQVSNIDHSRQVIGKAGRVRNRGFRPTVRGKVMSPAAHPHGGGEGRNPIGLTHPKTKWGKPARGVKTRKRHHPSNRVILARRKKR